MASTKQSIASRRVLNGEAPLKWLYRETPVSAEDNGWRFLALEDSQEFVSDPEHLTLCQVEDIIRLLPQVVQVLNFPVGTDLQVIVDDETEQLYFYDNVAETAVI